MSIRIIEPKPSEKRRRPTVRLVCTTPLPPMDSQESGFIAASIPWAQSGRRGMNSAAGETARILAYKVDSRDVEVELQIQPHMPAISIPEDELVRIMSTIAENASASVEPGPSKVSLCTWWYGDLVGLDAVGHGGIIDPAVRNRLHSPGFTTRVGDWDTGFGIYDAVCRAERFGATISVMESDKGVLFRLALAVNQATPVFMSAGNDTAPGESDGRTLETAFREESLWFQIAGQELLGEGSCLIEA